MAARASTVKSAITAVARRHVLGDRGVAMVAEGPPMRGDPFALKKDLDGSAASDAPFPAEPYCFTEWRLRPGRCRLPVSLQNTLGPLPLPSHLKYGHA